MSGQEREALRAEFEAWKKAKGDPVEQPYGPYAYAQWEGFQAARAAQPAAVPVAVVGSGFQLLWTGSGSFAEHARQHGIKVGSPLYTAPQPAAPAVPQGWQPLTSAPDGVRVLLGPREAPVVGMVEQPVPWEEEQEPRCRVVHYNGNTLVSRYHCTEWAPLLAAAPQPDEVKP